MKSISVKEIVKEVDGVLIHGNEQTCIEGATTNSKQINNNDLFVPIIGERFDGHTFMEQALNSGASVSFTSKHNKEDIDTTSIDEDKAVIKVDDTLKAMQKLAAYSRNRFDVPLIGITGSVGKTTTKEMIAAVVETKFNTLKTEGNLNSQIGVSLMMMRFEDYHEAAVIEMGVSENGEMERLADIAKPNFAVMTNIGMSHINQFKTKENTRKEKLNIVNHFDEHSVLFVNGDDELLGQIKSFTQKETEIDVSDNTKAALEKCRVVTFGINGEYDFTAKNIESQDSSISFTMVNGNLEKDIKLNVPGMHNVINALAALAVANELGIDLDCAKEGLEKYRPIAMRGTIIDTGRYKIIDDTYNASPDSIKSGIDVLVGHKGATRTYAILADVLELGEASYDCHYDVGKYVSASSVDELVTVGNEAKAIAKAVADSNSSKKVNCFDDNKSAIEYLKDNIQDGSVLLVKGSRGMHMDEIVGELTQHH